MKKVLSILLVVALVATLFAGCGGDPSASVAPTDPAVSATPSAEPTTVAPTVDPKIAWKSNWKKGDALATINVYDTVNYLAVWGALTKYRMSEYGLKFGAAIAPVLNDQISINKYELIKTEAGRSTYTTAIVNLFLDPETTPDLMPALYASNTGVGAVFKQIGPDYLVDLAPHLEEGGVLYDYVKYLWKEMNTTGFWDAAKEALKAEDGAIYAIPRQEYTPTKRLIHFNWAAFAEMGIDAPTTLAELEAALAAWVAAGHNGFMFNQEWVTIDSIIAPIANMYGIDFDSGFNWKEMNGEPMFAYYFPQYLNVLQTVNKFAANGWVLESSEKAGHIAMCTDLTTDAKLAGGWGDAWNYLNNALMMYGEVWHGYGLQSSDYGWQWEPIAAEGYTASVTAESAFDYCYIAITNRQVTTEDEAGYSVPLRIMEYVNSCCSLEGDINYFHGKVGSPFAPSFFESGNQIWVTYEDENGVKTEYLRGNALADRFSQFGDDATLPDWKGVRPFLRTIHPLYTWVYDVCNGFQSGDWQARPAWGFNTSKDSVTVDETTWNFDEVYDLTKDEWVVAGASKREEVPSNMSEWEYYVEKASKPVEEGGYGITDFMYDYSADDKLWILDSGAYKEGISMFADVSRFPMGLTIYRFNESQHKCYPRLDEMNKYATENNVFIYNGFFAGVTEVLSGKEASAMMNKMNTIQKLAKDFTIAYLSGTKGDSDWQAYIDSLTDAGIEEVFEFYKYNTTTNVTEAKEGVKSMSYVIEYWKTKG